MTAQGHVLVVADRPEPAGQVALAHNDPRLDRSFREAVDPIDSKIPMA